MSEPTIPHFQDRFPFFGEFLMISPSGEVLAAPRNLTIANVSSTAAFLRWEFPRPRNVSINDVMFYITVVKGDEIVTRELTNQREEPPRVLLTFLEPNTEYTVKLQADSMKFPETEATAAAFKTLAHGKSESSDFRRNNR